MKTCWKCGGNGREIKESSRGVIYSDRPCPACLGTGKVAGVMNIFIPDVAWGHFWEKEPAGSWEFWAFRFRPPCMPGYQIRFHYGERVVAEAVVAKIERPGQSECEGTGRFRNRWKVFWTPDSFKDLREQACVTT